MENITETEILLFPGMEATLEGTGPFGIQEDDPTFLTVHWQLGKGKLPGCRSGMRGTN